LEEWCGIYSRKGGGSEHNTALFLYDIFLKHIHDRMFDSVRSVFQGSRFAPKQQEALEKFLYEDFLAYPECQYLRDEVLQKFDMGSQEYEGEEVIDSRMKVA